MVTYCTCNKKEHHKDYPKDYHIWANVLYLHHGESSYEYSYEYSTGLLALQKKTPPALPGPPNKIKDPRGPRHSSSAPPAAAHV